MTRDELIYILVLAACVMGVAVVCGMADVIDYYY